LISRVKISPLFIAKVIVYDHYNCPLTPEEIFGENTPENILT
jgi:hypothetical protein